MKPIQLPYHSDEFVSAVRVIRSYVIGLPPKCIQEAYPHLWTTYPWGKKWHESISPDSKGSTYSVALVN